MAASLAPEGMRDICAGDGLLLMAALACTPSSADAKVSRAREARVPPRLLPAAPPAAGVPAWLPMAAAMRASRVPDRTIDSHRDGQAWLQWYRTCADKSRQHEKSIAIKARLRTTTASVSSTPKSVVDMLPETSHSQGTISGY